MHSDSLLKALHTQPDMIYVQGHRGARGVLPENTLESFEYALSLGIQSLELDVLMTQDNILVATHNSALHPDTTRHLSGEWVNEDAFQIRNLTLQELQDFNVGACR
ncbi:MAG: glycerophosphodiester phosphodiesterase family protein, partial [Pseudomonadales bacterium]